MNSVICCLHEEPMGTGSACLEGGWAHTREASPLHVLTLMDGWPSAQATCLLHRTSMVSFPVSDPSLNTKTTGLSLAPWAGQTPHSTQRPQNNQTPYPLMSPVTCGFSKISLTSDMSTTSLTSTSLFLLLVYCPHLSQTRCTLSCGPQA